MNLIKKFIFVLGLSLLTLACAKTKSKEADIDGQPINSIYWSDGDSGRITLLNQKTIKFRLDDWDAPETGGVGAAVGGAKCEKERELGFETKAFMVTNTRENVRFSHKNEYDRYERLLIRIYSDEEEITIKAHEIGLIKSWKHDGGKQLEKRPDWCEYLANNP